MANTINKQLALAVVDWINGGDYSQPVSALRSYLPKLDPEELNELNVSVIGRSQNWTRLTRSGSGDYIHTVDVGVQKRVIPTDLDEIDALAELSEDLFERLKGDNLTLTSQTATFKEVQNEPLYLPDHLRKNIFTSIITVRYSIVR